MNAHNSEQSSQQTPRWREADSNPRSPARRIHQTIAADREHRGSRASENGEYANMAQFLRLSKRVEGFRDGVGENSGCEVALQVLGSLPVTSSRLFIGEPR
jgi:hypothetical protein